MKLLSDQDEESILARLPGFICVKSLDHKITAITLNCARFCGFTTIEQAIGHTDYDIPAKAVECADEFIKLDRLSISSGRKLQALQVLSYGSDWKVILSERTPITKEKEPNFIIKLYISAMDITNQGLAKGMLMLGSLDKKRFGIPKQANYIIDSTPPTLQLTPKQELCLFFLMRGKTMKEIALLLKISIKTVEDHIDLIKKKFNCYSKSQLIEKAVDCGLLYYIPKAFLKNIYP